MSERERASEFGVVFDENKGNGGGVFFQRAYWVVHLISVYSRKWRNRTTVTGWYGFVIDWGCASTKAKDNKM